MRDEEDDEEWEEEYAKTGYVCLYTNQHIHYGEDVVVYHVVSATPPNTERNLPITPDGSRLLWAPKFVLLEAWQSINESLTKVTEDEQLTRAPNSLVTCHYCGSSILFGELYVLALYGHINMSQRYPNGQHGRSTFEDLDKEPTAHCLCCYKRMHEEVIALWSEPIRQHKECELGMSTRCWRHGCSANENGLCDITRRPHIATV